MKLFPQSLASVTPSSHWESGLWHFPRAAESGEQALPAKPRQMKTLSRSSSSSADVSDYVILVLRYISLAHIKFKLQKHQR